MQNLDDWEAFTEPVSSQLTEEKKAFLEENMGGDSFIVTGAGGAGKSSWIRCGTGKPVKVGSTLQSGTKSFGLVLGKIDNKRCMFLDMPGFNTIDFDDWDIFFRLLTSMALMKQYNVKFRGVLYVDHMNDARESPAAKKILTWLSRFCGNEYKPNITIITTKWDGLDQDGIKERLELVRHWENTDLIKDLGSNIYHHGLVQDNGQNTTLHQFRDAQARKLRAEKMIAERYRNPSDLKLQVDRELENGVSLHNTEAGKWLKSYEPSGAPSGSSKSPEAGGKQRSSESASFWGSVRPDHIVRCIDLFVNAVRLYNAASSTGLYDAGPSFSFSTNFEDTGVFSDYAFFSDGSSTFDGFH